MFVIYHRKVFKDKQEEFYGDETRKDPFERTFEKAGKPILGEEYLQEETTISEKTRKMEKMRKIDTFFEKSGAILSVIKITPVYAILICFVIILVSDKDPVAAIIQQSFLVGLFFFIGIRAIDKGRLIARNTRNTIGVALFAAIISYVIAYFALNYAGGSIELRWWVILYFLSSIFGGIWRVRGFIFGI